MATQTNKKAELKGLHRISHCVVGVETPVTERVIDLVCGCAQVNQGLGADSISSHPGRQDFFMSKPQPGTSNGPPEHGNPGRTTVTPQSRAEESPGEPTQQPKCRKPQGAAVRSPQPHRQPSMLEQTQPWTKRPETPEHITPQAEARQSQGAQALASSHQE
ncbi:hypothetical protein CRENBAI_014997 [Crenichthys baileyi]|uniref:Uncharacterized protein n=1 Tax=Crenichthys baileyi TaxID=28760 RepID=A0AAV9SS26_9TELE